MPTKFSTVDYFMYLLLGNLPKLYMYCSGNYVILRCPDDLFLKVFPFEFFWNLFSLSVQVDHADDFLIVEGWAL